MSFLLLSLALALIYALAALASKWLIESLRLLSLAHGSVMLLSAYTYSLLCALGFLPVVSAAIGIAVAGGLGFVFGWASRRVISQDFALFTFAVQMAVIFGALVAPGPLRGALGMAGIPALPASQWLGRSGAAVVLGVVVLTVAIQLFKRFNRSWFVAACLVVAKSDEMAATFGLNPGLLRGQVGAAYGAVLGISGILMASLISFISPRSFDIGVSISVLSVCLIGMRIKGGVVVGSLLIIALPEMLRLTDLGAARAGYVQMTIAGTALLIVVLMTEMTESRREASPARS